MFRVGRCAICIYRYLGFTKFNKRVANKLEGKVSAATYTHVGALKKAQRWIKEYR